MILYMKQKPWSLRARFTIRDSRDQDLLQIEGEFSIGTRLHVMDMSGTELAFIRQKLLAFMPRYEIEIPGQPAALIAQRFTLFNKLFEIEEWGWKASGDFWAHEFTVSQGDRTLMTVSKAWFTWGDSYQLDIADPQDAIRLVCVLLAIDMAIASNQRNS